MRGRVAGRKAVDFETRERPEAVDKTRVRITLRFCSPGLEMLTTSIAPLVRRRILLEWITVPTRVHRHHAGTQSARPSATIVRAVRPLQYLWASVKEYAMGVPARARR